MQDQQQSLHMITKFKQLTAVQVANYNLCLVPSSVSLQTLPFCFALSHVTDLVASL